MTTKPDKSYIQFIQELKQEIKTSQIKAHLAVNLELILFYFKIGKAILEKQKQEGWGTKIIEKVSQDLKTEFSDMKGLSSSNLFYVRRFAEFIMAEITILPQLVGELEFEQKADKIAFFNIPWGHNRELLDQLSSNDQRLWYAKQIIQNGWSRNVLIHQIKSNLYKRQAIADKTHNFHLTLPAPQSDLAANLLKDEYNFEFLRGGDFKERELEDYLTDNIVKFLLELGKGFSFVGKQYHLEVGGQDFFVDLLFYNLELRCFVVIELKTGEFKPEYAGKLGFYLSVMDEKLKHQSDTDTIGIILCTKNNKEVSKHSVKYMMKPIGVSEYKIAEEITDKKIKEIMPSAHEILDFFTH
jgi:predicted nuclease of restriction endonuclease-like (RecB) superfamily